MPKSAKVATMVGHARRARRLRGRATEKPPRTRKRASGGTYATAYSSFARKPLISCVEAKYEVALRGIHAAHFRFSISTRALSGASCEIEFRECAALLLPPTLLSQQAAAKEKDGTDEEWCVASGINDYSLVILGKSRG